ncbi:MAG: ATPase, T2SS/T4P/T4SS family [Candidatus Acidiferrales bacterium]
MAGAKKKRLGEVLQSRGKISKADLARALEEQNGKVIQLGELLLERGLTGKTDLIDALEEVNNVAYVDCGNVRPEPEVIRLLPRALAERCCAVPIRREGSRLVVVLAQPQDLNILNQLCFSTGLEISPRFGFREEILSAIRRAYSSSESDAPTSRNDGEKSRQEDSSGSQEMEFVSTSTRQNNRDAIQEIQVELMQRRTPAVRLVSDIILAAMDKQASDIHIEPQSGGIAVRLRVDGVLRDLRQIPRELQNSLISRIKILSDMDIAERRSPQDGRFLVKMPGHQLDMRVSSIPTQYGEKIVLRLLETESSTQTLPQLGMDPEIEQKFRQLLSLPQGTLLVVGPTGSGKSTTLYSALNFIRKPSVNIITVEDPVEYVLPGINQVHVNTKAGLTFASCLRSILRQDPNIIMVGEIRDHETAEICMKAAQTGHLVLSTLHSNDSISAIIRLLDLEIPGYLIAASVSGILAQRLVRKLCVCSSRVPADPDFIAQMLAAGATHAPEFRGVPVGCPTCDHTGYKGRIGVFELLLLDEGVKNLVRTTARSEEIRDWVRGQGMTLMQEDALLKVDRGLTTLEEIQRVVRFENASSLECANCERKLAPAFNYCPYCGERRLHTLQQSGSTDSVPESILSR